MSVMRPKPVTSLCLLAGLAWATGCGRIVGFDSATARLGIDGGLLGIDGGTQASALPPNCEEVASAQAGQAETPLLIPRAPASLSLAFPTSDDWCRSPRVLVEKAAKPNVTKASFRALWSPEALWILLTWSDDRWFTSNFFGYNNDGFEVLIDPNASKESTIQPDDAQVSVVVGSREINSISRGAPDHQFPTADVKFDMAGDSVTWLLRLPWSEMASPTAVQGQRIGLEFRLRDTDGEESARTTGWKNAEGWEADPSGWASAILE